MEVLAEKIHLVASDKNNILDIYTVVQRVHQVIDQCTGESCNCLSFLQSISNLLMRIEGEETTHEQKLLFHRLCFDNKNCFLLYDQINKNFGSEIFNNEIPILKTAIYFEIEKIKKHFKILDGVEKLEGNLYVFSKSFFYFISEKNPKMSITNEQINLRLAEIYHSLNRIQDLVDVIMYNPFINTEIKELFLNW